MVTDPHVHFHRNWGLKGVAEYDPQTEKWSVHGHVWLKGAAINGRIPTSFDVVTGRMDISVTNISSLEGCPRKCDILDARNNPLLSLAHVPQCRQLHIQYCYDLNNLEHMPALDLLHISWYPHLPMLRCLMAQQVKITTGAYSLILEDVLNDPKWAGKGKLGVLNCALEMKKRGQMVTEPGGENPFLQNARW